MTLNKFCPVAQGEYYNIKSQTESQLFFPFFPKFFLLRDMMKHHITLIEYAIYNIWRFEAGLVMISQNM